MEKEREMEQRLKVQRAETEASEAWWSERMGSGSQGLRVEFVLGQKKGHLFLENGKKGEVG